MILSLRLKNRQWLPRNKRKCGAAGTSETAKMHHILYVEILRELLATTMEGSGVGHDAEMIEAERFRAQVRGGSLLHHVPNRRPWFPTSTPPPRPSAHPSDFSIRSQRDYFGFNPTAQQRLPFLPPLPRSSIPESESIISKIRAVCRCAIQKSFVTQT